MAWAGEPDELRLRHIDLAILGAFCVALFAANRGNIQQRWMA